MSDTSNLLQQSRRTIEHAINQYQPKAIAMMFSGGDDSLTAYHVLKQLGYTPDCVIFGNTRTGIPKTAQFIESEVSRNNDKLVIADAGSSYERYVRRKGFFGKGHTAHNFSYHVLKKEHFEKAVSRHLRKKRKNYPILFVNGARRQESQNRMVSMKEATQVSKSKPNDIWCNIINEWTDHQCKAFPEENGIQRNPVSIELCKSGECMCGTMQSQADRELASYLFPDWGRWLDKLEQEVVKKFPWKWGQGISKQHLAEQEGQLNWIDTPMCQDCKREFDEDSNQNNDQ